MAAGQFTVPQKAHANLFNATGLLADIVAELAPQPAGAKVLQ